MVPCRWGFETRAEHALTRTDADTFELSVGVGTRGHGQGAFVHLCDVKNAIPEGVHPVAILEFPNRVPGAPPIQVRTVLAQRC
jgi:hypothetical protein